MSWSRALALVVVLCLTGPSLLTAAAEEPVTIDAFLGDLQDVTLAFNKSLINSTLALEMPPGAEIVSAELTIEGVEGIAAESSSLNFTNGRLNTDVFAYYEQGRGLYPPTVDPRNHRWAAATNREVPLIQKSDDSYWKTETQDPQAGAPPGAWPIQLYRFIPMTTGAQDVTILWEGYSTSAFNQTNPNHAEMWLYNHTGNEWAKVTTYDIKNLTDEWMNYTFDLPSPFVDADGSIDIAITGLPSQWAGPMLPAYDEGRLYTDFIELEVASAGGVQYPSDVSLYIDDVMVTTVIGNITDPVTLDDTYGFASGLQSILDAHKVTPDNVTLDFAFAVGRPTAGRLMVRDLAITYSPVVNQAPLYSGPLTVDITEDAGKQLILDLDTAFDDDHNKGELVFQVTDVDDSQFPGSILAWITAGPGDNTSLYVTPDVDFFGGPVNVTISAVDAFDAEVSAVVGVMVDQVGDRPVLETGGTMEAFERASFQYVFTATDVDLPDDSFTFSDTSDEFDVDPLTGELDWTPASNQIGEHRFGVTVTDRFGLQDSQLFTIDVKNSNDPPVIVSGLTVSAVEDVEEVYNIRAEDPDVPFGDVLTYFAFTDGIDVTVDQNTGRLTFTPTNDQVPVFDITIRVQDTIGTTTEETLVVTVENVNDPPAFVDPGNLVRNQGETVVFQLEVTDPDMDVDLPVPEVLTFTGIGPAMFLPDSDGLVSFVADQSMVGTQDVTYTVKDRAGAQDVITLTWRIKDVNDAPSIITQLPDDIQEDVPFSVAMEAMDLDGDEITWSDDSPLFDIDPDTGLVEFTPTQANVGNLLITFTVSDGRGGDSMLTWDLQVVNVNDDPVITGSGPGSGETFEEGTAIALTAQATDEDGDTLTFTWKKGDKVLGTGAAVEVDDLAPGKHTITLLVEDGNGGIATLAIDLEVTSAGMSSSVAMVALLVVVLVVIVGAVLYMRSRSSGEAPPQEEAEDVAEDTDVDKMGVTYESAGILEYETEGAATRSEGTTGSIEEPIYSLEEAEEYKPE